MSNRNPLLQILLLFAALALASVPLAAGAEEAAEPADDWTVLIYMCGSDLESQNGMATFNLNEISQARPVTQRLLDDFGTLYITDVEGLQGVDGRVNVLIETGGSRQWHALESVGLDIATDRLQRYEYDPVGQGGFVLLDEQPAASMSAPESLADFIRWGVAARPAQKYALVLWDHGGGSRSGLFVDELFEGDIMELDELRAALEGGQAHFDTVIIDACMMANLETAQAVAPYADYLVASEEIAAGYGGAYKTWLSCLYLNPKSGAEQFSRAVCDAIQQKYADMGHEQASDMLTYSVIDLAKMDRVSAAFDALMENMGRLYEDSPMLFNVMSTVMDRAERYGMGDEHMIDISTALSQDQAVFTLDSDVRNELIDALVDAVVYTVKGPGRSGAHGLSFCYDLAMPTQVLERYARNCQSAPYLALLDIANDEWTAPEWVYEQVAPLKPMDTEADYRLDMSTIIEDGLPQLVLTDSRARKHTVDYVLYYLDDSAGALCRLGRDACNILEFSEGRQVYGMDAPGSWPAVDGVLCDIEKVNENAEYVVYNIPIQMGDTVYSMRASYLYDTTLLEQAQDILLNDRALSGENEGALLTAQAGQVFEYSGHYELYGMWEGYNGDTAMSNRNIVSFSAVQGREFALLYPIYAGRDAGRVSYAASEPLTMYRGMEIEVAPLPEGTYYTAFVVTDVFDKEYITDPIELRWDGERFQAAG